MKNKGFTLAEILITLAVIGVVAVLSIGIFMPKIQDKVLATQTKTAKIKFTKAMEQMALNNKIGPLYQDTEEFVSELQNYLKLAKVCKNDKLAECFGYESFVDAAGETRLLDDIKDGKGFNLPKDNENDFEGDTVGIVTIDGTPMILAWNKKCEMLEPGVYEWNGDTNKSTNCIAAVIDVNGTKRPDKLGKDIVLLNASNIGACIQFTVNGTTYKWGCPFLATPLSYSECMQLRSAGKISSCASSSNSQWTTYDGDRWAGAVKTCGGTNKMPSMADLAALATYVYDRESNPIAAYQEITSGLSMNAKKLIKLNPVFYESYSQGRPLTYSGGGGSGHPLYQSTVYLWSGHERNATSAYTQCLFSGSVNYYGTLYDRYRINILTVCKQ